MPGLYRLVYVSERAPTCTDDDIVAILTQSRRNNERDGVNGALIVSGRGFAQILEGDRSALERTFERIGLDERHRRAMILDFKPVSRRRFSRWSMADATGAKCANSCPALASASSSAGFSVEAERLTAIAYAMANQEPAPALAPQ